MFEPAYQGLFLKSCLEERLNLKFVQERHVSKLPPGMFLMMNMVYHDFRLFTDLVEWSRSWGPRLLEPFRSRQDL
jgi:hypothetical protein